MSARSWSISLGKVGIAYACDLTGGAATLTFLQEASANAINALFPDPARERVVRFLDDVEVKLQGDIDAGRLEEERMPVLLSHAEDLLRRHVFGSYDLGLVAGNPGKAVERALRRGERLLQSLGGDDRQYLRQILISFFEVLAADYDLFSDLQEAFRHELGADIAGIEAMGWTPPSDGVISARKERTWGAFDQRRRRPWTGLTSLASIYQRGVSNSMGQRRTASRCSAKSFREKSSSYSSPKRRRAWL